ncbi:hypothetical protein A9Q99_25465 [Gammaproteobacteria bacterium 45_16_T64]|nr:hypothetical protein A9Q99_25465 [Gammaproteobacteria bacterium 45_16_T64]
MTIRHSINGLVEILSWMESRGHERDSLLTGTHISAERLSDPEATLSNQEELRFYQNLHDVSTDNSIYLQAGLHLNISSYGLWGLALLSSPTIGKAIEFGIQYIAFSYTYNTVTFSHDNTNARLQIHSKPSLGTLEQPMVERDISAIYKIFTALTQKKDPIQEIQVTWESRDKQEPQQYQRLFQCPIRFNCVENNVLFDPAIVNHALPQNNPLTVKMCQQYLDQRLPTIASEDSATEHVTQYFIHTPAYKLNLEDCAKELDLSSRHLARTLKNEGASFKELMEQWKLSLAKRYLSQTNMTLEEIAERLGYSDAANFSHAFKRWTGMPPRKYRGNH